MTTKKLKKNNTNCRKLSKTEKIKFTKEIKKCTKPCMSLTSASKRKKCIKKN